MKLPRLEAEIYNITSEQPVFVRAGEANFTSVGNFRAIIPGRPLVRRNNWMEQNAHLTWIWEQTQILSFETSAWLSFGWNVTKMRLTLVNYFILYRLKAGCLSRLFQLYDTGHQWSVIINFLFKETHVVFFLALCPNKSGLMSVQGTRCFPAERQGY